MRLLIAFISCLITLSVFCQNEYSLSFDGSNDFVQCPQTLNLSSTENFTIAVDFNVTGTSDFWQPILSTVCCDQGGLAIIVNPDMSLLLWTGQDAYIISPQLYGNTFYNLLLEYSNGTLNAYLNQDFSENPIFSDQIALYESNANSLFFGAREHPNGNAVPNDFFEGIIDNVSYWHIIMDETQKNQFINCPLSGNENGLVGCWDFEEGSGMNVSDISGNGNNGIINGPSWSTVTPNQNCVIEGCLDESACNYDSTATIDDGSCEYITPVDLGDDIETCAESVTLDAGTGYDSYLWSTGETTQTIEVTETGDYSVEVANYILNENDVYIPDYLSQNNLLAWWPFNGNADDESGNGVDGIINGASLTNDRYNNSDKAYLFSNGSNISTVNSPLDDLAQVTLSFWMKLSSSPSSYSVLISEWPEGGSTFKVDYNADNEILRFNLNTSNGSFEISESVSINELLTWSHVAISYDSESEINLYVNGSLASNTPSIGGSISISANQIIFGNEDNNSAPYEGSLDDIVIFADALTEDEINNLFNTQSNCSSLGTINITFNASGCADELACNYDAEATCDDGSCEYITPVDLGDDIETCDESVTLDAGPGYDSYLWSTGETTQTIEVNEAGDYSVEVQNVYDIQNVPSYIPLEGLISYWPFNGNANDESGNGYNGQNNGASLTNDRNGEENSAYNFNGNAQIILPDMPSPNEFTISAWVTDQGFTTSHIYSDFAGDIVEGIALLKNTNGIYGHVAGNNSYGACLSNTNLIESQWNHVLFIRDNSNVSFWINGQIVSSECNTENPDDRIGNAFIGSSPTSQEFWNGDIDDIAFWDRPLSIEEINNLYNNSSTCISSDTISITFNSSGCTDEIACNYDSDATCDDGSCEYITPVDLGDDIETCDEYVTLDAGAGYDSYLWSTGETTQAIEVNESGDYSVEAVNTWGISMPAYIPSDGLVAWWPFNGNALDESGNENHGSIVNAELTTDRFGNTESAFSFNGQDQSINSNNPSFNFNEDFTISMWCESHGLQNNQTIINSNPHAVLTLNYNYQSAPSEGIMLLYGDGDIWINNTSDNIVSTSESLQNQWMHIVLSKEDGVWKFYENNNLIHSFNEIASLLNEDVGISLGKCGSICDEFFNGKIDDFAFWNRALNPEEIINLFNAENSCVSSDQVNVAFNNSGCTDDIACNYDSEAICDDGSCEYITPVSLGDDIETCDESVTLDAGAGYYSYLWSTGETTQTIEVNESGNYSVEVTSGSSNNYSIDVSNNNDISLDVEENNLNVAITNNLSISGWVKLDSEITQGYVCAYWPDGLNGAMQYAMIIGSGKIYFIAGPGNVNQNQFEQGSGNIGNQELSIETWHYITITYDGEYLKFYINGELDYERYIIADFDNFNNGYFTIGAHADGLYGLNGKIDNLEIWNTALEQNSIFEKMHCPSLGDEEGLLAAWNFEEGEGNNIYDLSGNNNGTMNGANWSSDTPDQNCISCQSNDEISITFNSSGCTDSNACNYDMNAICDDGSCLYFDECGDCGGNGTSGCTDMISCNYDSEADCDDESCLYPEQYYDCNGNCLNDEDGDGVCNELEIPGCTDQEADNYDASATDDDGMCEYLGCTNPSAENYDSTANVDDGSCIILGCMDSDAANYNAEANQEDESCLYDIDYVNDATDDAFDDGYDGGYDDGVESVDCPLCPPCDNDCPGDYTGDGIVSVGDLLEFLILFGNQCE